PSRIVVGEISDRAKQFAADILKFMRTLRGETKLGSDPDFAQQNSGSDPNFPTKTPPKPPTVGVHRLVMKAAVLCGTLFMAT
ncbi:MAG: hypothetical protein K0A92_07170, partial [Methyloprofundus sp.]|nr:hypothetical protein [Methyloprofundus sp.]